MAALDVLEALEAEGRPATSDERQTLARWSSWGAIPEVFDPRHGEGAWRDEHVQLREQLTDQQWQEGRRTTLNAHYTDPAYVASMWSTLAEMGFDGGAALEPGRGMGRFIGMAPEGAHITGIEMDSTTARIAQALADVRAESCVDTKVNSGRFDLAEETLEQRKPKVTIQVEPDGPRVLNPEMTAGVQEKLGQLQFIRALCRHDRPCQLTSWRARHRRLLR